MIKEGFGRVTLPTDTDIVAETLDIMRLLGADAIRDADGTTFPPQLKDCNAKIYATYYTTRKDNKWAQENPDEVQQCYIMTAFYTAEQENLAIPVMQGLSKDLLLPNTRDDIKRWWEVINRTTGEVVSPKNWRYAADTGTVIIEKATPFHEYTVSFLAYLIWDPVHMYNSVTNDWKDMPRQITFDVRQPKTRAYSMERLRKFLEEHDYVDVVRFTTFFHQFTLIFDSLRREKYVDWYGYSASVSPYILEKFEKQAGYRFRPEFIIDQGYYNNQYRVPTKEYRDFMDFQVQEVCALAKEMVEICHEYGKEAMMFLGDHFIGTEPYLEAFKTIGLDAVVGSVGNGSTLRLISDIQGVQYTEGRFLPYFFPDTFCEGGNPVAQAKENWITARRALLRSPVQRIGYGGYLKLALQFPDFIDYIKSICQEFRTLYQRIEGAKPINFKTVGVLNAWGKSRSWGCHMVHHALYQPLNYSYAGVIEALSGAPFAVRFISFEDLLADSQTLKDVDCIINVGDGGTAHSGGEYWENPLIVSALRKFVFDGGGFIGIGEPSAYQKQGRYFQLSSLLGVEQEHGFTFGYDKYNWDIKEHFILEDAAGEVDFGKGKNNIFALEHTDVLAVKEDSVQMAANTFGRGRSVYLAGLPYSFENARILHRAILWACSAEHMLHNWFSSNVSVDVHAYHNGQYCVVNNTDEGQHATIYAEEGKQVPLYLEPGGIAWFSVQ